MQHPLAKAISVWVIAICIAWAVSWQLPVYYLLILVVIAPLPAFKVLWDAPQRRRAERRARIDELFD